MPYECIYYVIFPQQTVDPCQPQKKTGNFSRRCDFLKRMGFPIRTTYPPEN